MSDTPKMTPQENESRLYHIIQAAIDRKFDYCDGEARGCPACGWFESHKSDCLLARIRDAGPPLDRLRAERPAASHENELLFDPNEVREAAQPTAEEESELREVIKLVRRAYAANEQSALKDFHTLDFYDKLESYLDSVAQAVAAARLAEREACAKVAENGRFLYDDAPDAKFGRACATAIRRRAELEKGR